MGCAVTRLSRSIAPIRNFTFRRIYGSSMRDRITTTTVRANIFSVTCRF